jgi:hypothetical protein
MLIVLGSSRVGALQAAAGDAVRPIVSRRWTQARFNPNLGTGTSTDTGADTNADAPLNSDGEGK